MSERQEFSVWIREKFRVYEPSTPGGHVLCITRGSLETWPEGGYPPRWMWDEYVAECGHE